jgi:hypothetical protein
MTAAEQARALADRMYSAERLAAMSRDELECELRTVLLVFAQDNRDLKRLRHALFVALTPEQEQAVTDAWTFLRGSPPGVAPAD